MINDLNAEQLKREQCMSEISERCYAAGWMDNLEYILWDAVLNGERKYGRDLITTKDIQQLSFLSQVSCS